MANYLLKLTLPLTLISMAVYIVLLPFIHYPITTLLKPLPILLLMLFTSLSNTQKLVKIPLLCALGFSLIGDVVLTLPIRHAIEMGILAFMAAHCMYISLFLRNRQGTKQKLFAFLPVMFFVIGGFIYLWPHLHAMKVSVGVYMCVLTLLVFFAFQSRQQLFLLGSGALLFLISDFILALELFVFSSNPITGILIMLFYYSAQLLLVLGFTKIRIPAKR